MSVAGHAHKPEDEEVEEGVAASQALPGAVKALLLLVIWKRFTLYDPVAGVWVFAAAVTVT